MPVSLTEKQHFEEANYAFVAAAYPQSSHQSFFSCNHSKNAITADNHH